MVVFFNTKEGTIINSEKEHMYLLQSLGKKIRTERRKANISMERLAELSNVSLQTIKDIEHAKRACQIDTFVSIASALHLSADYLLELPYDTEVRDKGEYEFLYHLYHTLDDRQRTLLREIAKLMVSLPQ